MALKTTGIPKAENPQQEGASESCSNKDKASECNEKAQELASICQNFAYQKSTLSIRQKNLGNETSKGEVFNQNCNSVSSDVVSLSPEINHGINVNGDKPKKDIMGNKTTKTINFETEKCLKSAIKNQNDIEKLNNLDFDQEMAETIEGITRQKDGTDFEIVSEKQIVPKCDEDESEADRDSGDFRAPKQRTRGGRSKATESKVNSKRKVSQTVKRKQLASNESEVEDQLQESPKKLKRSESSSKSKRGESSKYNGLRTSKRNKLTKSKASLSLEKVEAISLDDYDKVDLSGISTVQELHVDQIRSLVRSMERDTRDIFEGKTFCERHQDYKKGGQSRANLAYNLHYGQFTEEQQETVTDTLRQQFCYKHAKYFDYILKVLVPETMMMILSKVHSSLSVEEVKRMVIEGYD